MCKKLLPLLCLLNVTGCGLQRIKAKKVPTTATLNLYNSTTILSSTTGVPSEFAVKLKSVSLGNLGGSPTMIWAHPLCATTTVDDEKGATISGLKSDEECASAGLPFFDLNRDASELNQELGSKAVGVSAGTYSIVTFSLLDANSGSEVDAATNVKWAYAEGGLAAREFSGIPSERTVAIDPPLVVDESESAYLLISYNLEGAVTADPSTPTVRTEAGQDNVYDDCSDDLKFCVTVPQIKSSETYR